MAGNLQNIILGFELTPPEGNWEGIASRLDAEVDNSSLRLSEKIGNFQLNPPIDAWTNISTSLSTSTRITRIPVTEPAKVVPLYKRRWMSAAVATGLVLIAAIFYFVRPGQHSNLPSNSSEIAGAENEVVEPNIASDAIGPLAGLIPQIASAEEEIPGSQSIKAKADSGLSNENGLLPQDFNTSQDINQDEHVIHSISRNDISKEKPFKEVKITAPPIRDKDGNIILNMDLLTSRSADYITVTGPNGEQTRVSSKFAQYLAFMNEGSADQDSYLDFLFKQSGMWREKFMDWRTKLVEQSAFAPSSAYFFDILELKELIKE